MSVRSTRLCDMSTGPQDTTAPCDKPALGVCFICDKDVCREHTPHERGALVVSLFLLLGNKSCEHDGSGKPQQQTIFNGHYYLCTDCKRAIDRLGGNVEQIADELREAARTGIKAALTAKGLE